MLKEKNNNSQKIEFSIISRGTEKAGPSPGYMAVTFCNAEGGRKIIPIPHGIVQTSPNICSLNIKKEISIEKIAFSRFQLIPAIMYKKNKNYLDKKKEILVIGSGSIGFTTCMELFRQGHKNISLLLRNNKKINVNIFKKVYGFSLKLTSDIKKIEKFTSIIDATGSSDVLRKIIERCPPFSTIFILGTPRKKPAINSLIIHRKSLHLIGCHEIIGISNKERNEIFNEIIKDNKKHPQNLFEEISNIEHYSKRNRENILKKSEKIINILRYNQKA